MRKLKKILAIALAGAMLSSMMVMPSYAEDPATTTTDNNTNSDDTSTPTIPVTKILDVNTGAAIPTVDFTFELTPVTGLPTGDNVKKRDDLPLKDGILNNGDLNSSIDKLTAKVSFDGSETKKTSGGLDEYTETTEFDFSKVKYPAEAARYVYKVEEVVDTNNEGFIHYDTTTYNDVEVVVNNEGTVKYIISYNDDGTYTKSDKDTLQFRNKCNSTTIVVKKELDGDGIQSSDSDVDFSFSFYIPAAADNVDDTTLSKVTGDLYIDPNQEFTATIVRQDNTTEKDTIKIGEYCNFTLKAGETFTVDSAPVGMIYQVKENLASDSKYTCYISARKIEDNQSKDIQKGQYDNNTYEGKTVSDSNPVTFINTRNMPIANGVMLDIAPYALVVLLILAGTVVLFVRKKRSVK